MSSVSISNAARLSDLRVSGVADSLSLKRNMHEAILLVRQVLIAARSVAGGEPHNGLAQGRDGALVLHRPCGLRLVDLAEHFGSPAVSLQTGTAAFRVVYTPLRVAVVRQVRKLHLPGNGVCGCP